MKVDFKYIARKIFEEYAKEHPESVQGYYLSGRTNRVLAFDKYINSLSLAQLDELSPELLTLSELEELKQTINKMIMDYLRDNIKTLALV